MKPSEDLSQRENQVLELIAWGASQKEAASYLHIARDTVDNHVRKIKAKLGLSKMTELSAYWFCTRFNISYSLSPLQRSCIAVCLLVLVAFTEIIQLDDYCRYRMGKGKAKIEISARRARCRYEPLEL